MKVVFISAQHPDRVSRSSILRTYSELKKNYQNIEFFCLTNNIFHHFFGKDKILLRKEKKFLKSFSFWYYPGLIKIGDNFLTRLWCASLIKKINLERMQGEKVHFIVEAGTSSVVALEIWLKLKNSQIDFSMHYRINDPIDAFRSISLTCIIRTSHDSLLLFSKADKRLVCSSPASIEGVLHIPPGIPRTILKHKKIKKGCKKYIVYSGMYPIQSSTLKSLVNCLPNKIIKYTGNINHKIKCTEHIGVISANDVDNLLIHAEAGIMIFPDNQFHWWLWSNKMMVMKFLKIPIYGFLKNESRDVFKSNKESIDLFKQHGLVEVGCNREERLIEMHKIYDWGDFSRRLLRPTKWN